MRKSKQKKKLNVNIDESVVMEAIKSDQSYETVRSIIETQVDYIQGPLSNKLLLYISEYYSTDIFNYFLKNTDGVLIEFSMLAENKDKKNMLYFIVTRHTINELRIIVDKGLQRNKYDWYRSAIALQNNEKKTVLNLTPLHQDEKFCRLLFNRATWTLLQILKQPPLLKLYLETYSFDLQVFLLSQLQLRVGFRRNMIKAIEAEPKIYHYLIKLHEHLIEGKPRFLADSLKRVFDKIHKKNIKQETSSSKHTLFRKRRTVSLSDLTQKTNQLHQ